MQQSPGTRQILTNDPLFIQLKPVGEPNHGCVNAIDCHENVKAAVDKTLQELKVLYLYMCMCVGLCVWVTLGVCLCKCQCLYGWLWVCVCASVSVWVGDLGLLLVAGVNM